MRLPAFARQRDGFLAIGNSAFERRLVTQPGAACVTISFANRLSGRDYALPGTAEFSFRANGTSLTAGNFIYQHAEMFDGDPAEAAISLQGKTLPLAVTLHLQAYQAHPILRKWLTIENRGSEPIVLTDLDWEDVNLMVDTAATAEVWSDYFTWRGKAALVSMDDCALLVNDFDRHEGFIVATEAPGPLKRMEVYARPGRVAVGYNRDDETIFEWRLAPGETFTSPASFILPYANQVAQAVVDGAYARYIQEHLTVCDVAQVPTVTVNTWEPFGTEIDRGRLLQQIDIAAEMGVDAYQVDDGWFDRKGDWQVDRAKFPHGLEEIANHCRERGMRFGLWMAVATVHQDSRVCREHPEWIALDRSGRPNRHERPDEVTMCLDSGYYDVILAQLDHVITRYCVELLKLDLSAVRNVYAPGRYPGCFAANHAHRSPGESHVRIMARLFDLVRALKARHPRCLVDLSYELYGVVDGTDLALTAVADQNWVTNISSPNEVSLRREIYQRGRVTRPWTLNFGGTRLDHPNAPHYGLFSTLASHALFWGDLARIDPETRAIYRRWFAWAKEQRARSDFYRYYRVADVFPVPDGDSTRDYRHFIPANRYGVAPRGVHPPAFNPLADRLGEWWDGVARLDERGEGPIFLFRPGASREERFLLHIPWVQPDIFYGVRDEINALDLGPFLGNELIERGIEVRIAEPGRAAVLVLRRLQEITGPDRENRPGAG